MTTKPVLDVKARINIGMAIKDKNFDKDKWISKARSPYERVFSRVSNRSRYRGIAKNQFQVFMESLVFNFKRLIKLEDKKLSFAT